MKKLHAISDETGVSMDYANEVYRLLRTFEVKGWQGVLDVLRTIPCRKYEERFSSEKYIDVITQENQERIASINAHAQALNALSIHTDASADMIREFRQRYNAVMELLYGDPETVKKVIWPYADDDKPYES